MASEFRFTIRKRRTVIDFHGTIVWSLATNPTSNWATSSSRAHASFTSVMDGAGYHQWPAMDIIVIGCKILVRDLRTIVDFHGAIVLSMATDPTLYWTASTTFAGETLAASGPFVGNSLHKSRSRLAMFIFHRCIEPRGSFWGIFRGVLWAVL